MNCERFIVSRDNDKFVYNPNKNFTLDKDIFTNDERSELLSMIESIYQKPTFEELYMEINAISILPEDVIQKIIRSVCAFKLDALLITHLLSFTRNKVSIVSFTLRKLATVNSYFEIRIASAGNVDAGKSTLLGVLSSGLLDDGRGLARAKIFRYKHELVSGRTSSVGSCVISVGSNGKIIETSRSGGSRIELDTVSSQASKALDFYDLAGHEKYLKTTIFGLVGHKPDYVMLVIGSNMGLIGMAREHLILSFALKIPVFFVFTKTDLCPENVRKESMARLIKEIKNPRVGRKHIIVKQPEDVIIASLNLRSNKICPIFQVSCVTGEGLSLLKMFLSLLPRRKIFDMDEPALFSINDIYKGIGCVVCGVVIRGSLKKNSNLLIGPGSKGEFVNPGIKSIHRKRSNVEVVYAGQSASIALKKLKVDDVRKGMVIVSGLPAPRAYWQFKALVHILHHPTTISIKYQAVVHVGTVRQACSIIWMEKKVLRTGDEAHVIMAFQTRPEFLVLESTVVFREGRTKAVGIIKELLKPTRCKNSLTLSLTPLNLRHFLNNKKR